MRHGLLLLMLFAALVPGVVSGQEMRADIDADSLVAEAERYVGAPYRYGGKGPKGFDCAGFTRYVYGRFGVQLPPSSVGQYPVGRAVERGAWQVGDLVFFGGRVRRHTIGHVGIVTSADSLGFAFIHASNSGVRVSASSEEYYASRYLGACRLIAGASGAGASGTAAGGGGTSEEAEEADTVYTIALAGDVMLGTTYPTPMLPLDGGRHLFDAVRERLREADVAAANLEGAICDTSLACRKREGQYSYAFRMPPEYAPLLRDAGFDFVSLANNHSNDFGAEGLSQTMSVLDSLGIGYAGVKKRCPSVLLRRGNITFGFAAFGHNGHTPSLADSALVRRILEALNYACDILIVSFHGGAEGNGYAHLPDSTERFLGERRGHLRRFARLCVDLGADIVYGHGPHVPRAMEVYGGRLIAYSLGNFCTPVGISLSGMAAYAPLVTVRVGRSGVFLEGKIDSFFQPYRKGPRADSEHRAARLMRSLSEEDFERQSIVIGDEGVFFPIEPVEGAE